MPFANRRDLARLFEAFPRVLTDRFEKVETQSLGALIFDRHERFVEQLLEQLQHPIPLDIVASHDVLGRRQRPPPAKDGEPAQQHSLRLRQQLVDPVERCAQRLMSAGYGSTELDEAANTTVTVRRDE